MLDYLPSILGVIAIGLYLWQVRRDHRRRP